MSARIAKILSEKAFTFSPTQYLSIHRELFLGIYSHAGKIRDYNITKKEWVLDGDTVSYGGATELRETLEYDFSQERDFHYNGLTMDDVIHHLAVFISRLWQIHVFEEGNTRTTAVFLIKYLRMLGFDSENDLFAEHSWYFRNALVKEGRIEGAFLMGRMWLIPKVVKKPEDPRRVRKNGQDKK